MRAAWLGLFLVTACGTQAAVQKPPPPPESADARRAPDFTLTDTDGRQVTLSDELKRGPVILAFFPKAFTGG